MPLSYATYTGNSGSPQSSFNIPYSYILKDHIKVYYGRDILANTQTALLVNGTDYNFTSDTTIQLIGSTLNSGTTTGDPHNLANGVVLTLERDTPDSSQIVEFADGSNLIGDNLNNANLQNLFVVQEQQDKNDLSAAKAISSENAANTATNNVATLTATQFKTDGSTPMTGDINANSNKIKNLADPTNAQDGVTKAYLERSGSITSTQIADGTIVDGDINASANIAGSKLQAASGSNPGSMSSADKTKLDTIETSAKDDQTGAEIKSLYEGENNTNAFTDAEKSKLQNIESNAKDDQTGAEIKGLYEGENNTNAFTDAEQTKLANLDLTKLQNIEVNATQDQTAGEIKTLYESNSNTNPLTDAEKAVIDGVTANTSELNKLDGFTGDVNDLNQISGMSKQSSITNSASHFPTSAAVVNFVANQIAPVGGLEVIADEDSFPATQPVSGVVISISNADGLIINSSGEASNARTVGSSSDNVTIKNFPVSLRSKTLASNLGLLVSSTGASQEYNYHKLLAKETDVLQLSDDINDFAARYRVLNTLPSNSDSSNHDGDLVYAKDVGKIYVYSGDYNGTPVGTFGEVQSIGNFHISTLSPAFDGSTTAFTITNAPSSVAQILLSLNGVIQQPGTAFTLSGNTVTFASAPPSGSTYFAVVLGSTVNIGTPSNNTITSAMIIDGSIVNGDISNSANIAGSKLNLVSTSSTPGLEVKGDGSSDGYLQLNCSQNSHGIKLKSPPHSAGASYTLTFPNNIVNGQFLTTDANGNLSWAAITTDLVNDSSPQLGGDLQSNGHDIKLANNDKIILGTGNDAEIYHNDTDFFIDAEASGATRNLYITGGSVNEKLIELRSKDNEPHIRCYGDGAVMIYHDGSKKLETNASGIKLNGVENAGAQIKIGANDDIQIEHDGSNSAFKNSTGILYVQSDDLRLTSKTNGQLMFKATYTGAAELYNANARKLSTAAGGLEFFGRSVDCQVNFNNSSNSTRYGGVYGYVESGVPIMSFLKSNGSYSLVVNDNGEVRTYGHVRPQNDNSYDLGLSTHRWRNIYTNDLNLSNEGHGNDVDGTWGSYTIQEGAEDLFLINRRNGKKYKFNLTEVN